MPQCQVVHDNNLSQFLLRLGGKLLSVQPAETRIFAQPISYPANTGGGKHTVSLWLVVWESYPSDGGFKQ